MFQETTARANCKWKEQCSLSNRTKSWEAGAQELGRTREQAGQPGGAVQQALLFVLSARRSHGRVASTEEICFFERAF